VKRPQTDIRFCLPPSERWSTLALTKRSISTLSATSSRSTGIHPGADGHPCYLHRCPSQKRFLSQQLRQSQSDSSTGIGGNGSAPHMAGEAVQDDGGVSIWLMSLRGQGPALSDCLGGQCKSVRQCPEQPIHINRQAARVAVTSPRRAEVAAELPDGGRIALPG